MLKKFLLAVTSAALSTLVVAGIASAQPTTTTIHDSFSETTYDEVCNGEYADLTLEATTVFHVTEFEDGRYHAAGTVVGTFSFELDSVVYSGHFTQRFGENQNSKNANGTFTLAGQGRGSDGSRVQVSGLGHFATNANGDVTVAFDRFSITCA